MGWHLELQNLSRSQIILINDNLFKWLILGSGFAIFCIIRVKLKTYLGDYWWPNKLPSLKTPLKSVCVFHRFKENPRNFQTYWRFYYEWICSYIRKTKKTRGVLLKDKYFCHMLAVSTGLKYYFTVLDNNINRSISTGCPKKLMFFKGTPILQKFSDFQNFFTFRSAMNLLLCVC